MKIAILIYILSSLLSEVFGADNTKELNVQQQNELSSNTKSNVNVNNESNNKDNGNNHKRDSSEQIGIIGGDKIVMADFQPMYHPGYYQGRQLLAPIAHPQISYYKPDIKQLQGAPPKFYQPPIISAPAPIMSYVGGVKSVQQGAASGPFQIAYAIQPQYEYAFVAPMPAQEHHAVRPQVYLAPHASAASNVQTVILAVPQHLGQPQYDKDRVIQYAIMPSHELSLAKYLSSQPLLGPSSNSLYHHQPPSQPSPVYAYSIQPSVQISSAPLARQISIPAGTIQYKQQLAPPPPPQSVPASNSIPPVASSAQIKQLLNSFPQHITPHQAVTPKSISTVAPPVQQQLQQQYNHHHHPHQPVIYSTTATPYYNTPKIANSGPAPLYYATVSSDSNAAFSQPGAIHYGTHLYHPTLGKISSVGLGVRKYK